ncbi:MAG: hypothetical protein OXU23_15625 [Candidatus Poribacteria bacterium]|nr:hypothetical protein [Candidatus Poribacteria bacterium]
MANDGEKAAWAWLQELASIMWNLRLTIWVFGVAILFLSIVQLILIIWIISRE